jgi:4-hydroxyphenylpyruvate dioxygenase
MALFTSDIFNTLTLMRDASFYGGFEFMDRQPDSYYDNLPARLGDSLSAEQYESVRRLGLLADKDDQGVLLQIFTKPVGDRPTLFLEIIQVVLQLFMHSDACIYAYKYVLISVISFMLSYMLFSLFLLLTVTP